MKKVLIIIGAIIIVIFLIIKFWTPFVSPVMCFPPGDICDRDTKLQYILGRNSFLCGVVGGEFKQEAAEFGSVHKCYVKSTWMCSLRGGVYREYGRDLARINLEGSFYCGKK